MSIRRFVTLAAVVVVLTGSSRDLGAQQTGTLHGTITDQETTLALRNVQIVLVELNRQTTTDAAGSYQFTGVPVGPVLVQIRRLGYAPFNETVVIRADQTTTFDRALVQSPTELTPIVVTANREMQSLADVAASVSVADSTVIQSGRTGGLNEVLRYEPGIQATSRFGLDDVKLAIRGSGMRANFGVRGVAVILDGVPVTEPDGQTRLDIIELASARQVEVVRGPVSALYGGSASGGAVNIISRDAAESRGVRAKAQTGSFGFEKYNGGVGVSLNQSGGALVNGAYTRSDGFREHNQQKVTRFNLKSDYRFSPRTQLAIEGNTSNMDIKLPGSLTLGEFDVDPYQADPGKISQDWSRYDNRWRAGARLNQDVRLGTDIQTHTYLFGGQRDLDHPIFQVVVQDLDRFQAGNRSRFPLGSGRNPLRGTIGFDYDQVTGTDQRYVNQGGNRGPLLADADIRLPNIGAYGQLEAWLGTRWQLTAGLRYDKVTYDITDNLDPAQSAKTDFGEFSPKGTLAYRANRSTSFYGSVARGFEPPTLAEMTASPDPTETFNLSLEPQRLTNYELGFKTLVASRLFFNAAGFYTDITGEFIARSVSLGAGPPTTVFENAGKSRHIGVELGATALVTGWMDVAASYTWSDFTLTEFTGTTTAPDGSQVPTDFSGNRLPGVPQHRVGGEVRFRPFSGLTAGIGAEWQSKVFVDNANTDEGILWVRGFGPNPSVNPVPFSAVPSFGLINVNLMYRWRGAMAFFSVENVFDKVYVGNIAINSADGRFYDAGAGRYVSAGMQLSVWSGGF